MWVKKLLFSFFSIILYSLFFIQPVFAADEFSTSYDVTYDVQSDGLTNVTQKITLKNLTSQYYVSNFTLTIGSTEVLDVSAADEQGQMEVKLENQDNRTSIISRFNGQVAGLGKTQTFTLKFKSKDFAQRLGKTWEVNLPKIPSSGKIEGYSLVLSVPVVFGDPTSISPKPKSESQTFDRLFFSYGKDQLEKSGVSVNFGTDQIFNFKIKYPLENNSLFPVVTYITLPPDTNYQDVSITQLDPAPENVVLDEDGNYLAWYRLPRGSKYEVIVTGSAKLYIYPKDNPTLAVKKPVQLTPEEEKDLTKSDRFWEKDNPTIQATLNEIFKDGKPETNRDKAKLIYQYVVGTLKYDTSRINDQNIERLGAVTALNNLDKAVCMEFTDLFVALARAANVPTRELDGFAYTQNPQLRPLSLAKDLLHAWPEYYDQEKGWVMVDPTWESTSGGADYFNKFDLNHFILAIKGRSSQSPVLSDDVEVALSQADFIPRAQLDVLINTPGTIWSGLPVKVNVSVKNLGPSVQAPATLVVNTKKLELTGQKEVNLAAIPPYGHSNYDFSLKTELFGEPYDDTIEVMVAGQKINKQVQVRPIFSSQTYPYIIGALVALFGTVYGGILAIHYLKRKILYKKSR